MHDRAARAMFRERQERSLSKQADAESAFAKPRSVRTGRDFHAHMSIRLDRLITLYAVSPLRHLVSSANRSIPILMYHSVSDEDQAGLHPYYRTTTSRAAFFAQMEYLSRNKYRACSLHEVAAILKSAATQDDKRVVITFDDGFEDFYKDAFPVLDKFNLTATVFLPTSYIENDTRQFKGRNCLTWAQVRELQSCGITFGSHTANHPQLYKLSWDMVEKEVRVSKDAIEESTGCIVETFSYPYAFPQTSGQFKKALGDLLRRTGYHQGVCTRLGRADANSDPFFMERLPVNGADDLPLFQAKLSGAYDWVSKPQSLVKSVKSLATARTIPAQQ